MRSLKSRLLALWLLSMAASLAVAIALMQVYGESRSAQAGRADEILARACDLIVDRYAYFTAGWAGPEPGSGLADPGLRAELAAVGRFALAGPRLDGGIWQTDAGVIAPDTLDPALRDAVGTAAAEAIQEEQHATLRLESGGVPLVVRACPLPGPIAGLAGFVLTRQDSGGQVPARLGLGVLAALALVMTVVVGALLVVYARRIGAIEAALASGSGEVLPRLPLSGERDLDRLIAAFNEAGERLAVATGQAAAAERLAGLGRVAAGVAHEIRNPIAAMRLRAENALAGDDARRRAALDAILGQITRLDRLSADLLDMTRPATPQPVPTRLDTLLAAMADEHRHAAEGRQLVVEAAPVACLLDPLLLRRALDNLVQNALRAVAAGGTVRVTAIVSDGTVTLTVADDGPGIPPALVGRLFEPFVSGRADGTGLGLAIARETAASLGGSLVLADPGPPGAVFTLTIPAQEIAWPAS
jgi:signal transduction histidine kinase